MFSQVVDDISDLGPKFLILEHYLSYRKDCGAVFSLSQDVFGILGAVSTLGDKLPLVVAFILDVCNILLHQLEVAVARRTGS